jgi:hypothetical protein
VNLRRTCTYKGNRYQALITNSPDIEKSESQYSSQSFEQVNYGTQPDEMVQSFEDYDWEQDRMIKYRTNDKGGTDRL